MSIFNKLFGNNNDAQTCGEEFAQQLAAQGIDSDSANWPRIRQLAEDSGLDTVDFGMAVHDTLSGNVWCPNCRCTQPVAHVCFD